MCEDLRGVSYPELRRPKTVMLSPWYRDCPWAPPVRKLRHKTVAMSGWEAIPKQTCKSKHHDPHTSIQN